MPTVIANFHVPYDLQRKPYHKAVADLVCAHVGRNGLVLDIGCCVGHTLLEIRQQRPDLRFVASDMDARCLEITAGLVDLDESILATAEKLFPTERLFGCVVASYVLEHTHCRWILFEVLWVS